MPRTGLEVRDRVRALFPRWSARPPLLATFLVVGGLVLALILLATHVSMGRIQHQIQKNAVEHAAIPLARHVVTDLLPPMVLDRPLRSPLYEGVDRMVKDYITGSEIAHFKLWNRDGQAVYSTVPEQVGERHPDPEKLQRVLEAGTEWEVTDEPENPLGEDEAVVEVYTPVTWGNGAAGVLEVYIPYGHHAASFVTLRNVVFGSMLMIGLVTATGFGMLYRLASGRLRRARDETIRRNRGLELLTGMTGILSGPGAFRDKLTSALEEVREETGASAALFRTLNPQQGTFDLVAFARAEGVEIVPPASIPAQEGIGYTIGQPRTVVVNDAWSNEEEVRFHALPGQFRSAAAVPVKIGSQTVGVMDLLSTSPGRFTGEQVRLVEAVTDELGIYVDNARLQDQVRSELQRGQRRLVRLQEAAREMVQEDLQELMARSVDVAAQVMGARYAALTRWDGSQQDDAGSVTTWVMMANEGRRTLSDSPVHATVLQGIIERGRSVRLRDGMDSVLHEEVLPAGHPDVSDLVGTPVRPRRSPPAALMVAGRAAGGEFTSDEERLLDLYAVLVGLLMDNTRLYQDALQERDMLASVQAEMQDGLAIADSRGEIVRLNTVACEFLGLPEDEVVGRPVGEVLERMAENLEPPEAVETLRQVVRGEVSLPLVVEFHTSAPQVRDLEMHILPVSPSSERSSTGFLVRDVTQDRELERQKTNFLSLAAHQLRTPLTTLLGFSELLLKDKLPEATRQRGLQLINRDGQRLAAVVDDLLNVSRLQSRRVTLDTEGVWLYEVVDEAFEAVRPRTERHTFVAELPPDLPQILADREKLLHVIINLVDNAVKYSPEGERVCVVARPDPDAGRIVVEVADQGMGIAPEDQERLFTTFHRIRRPETEGISGTGLGLYLVNELVKLMGGELWVESELNVGTSFFFSIPTAPSES